VPGLLLPTLLLRHKGSSSIGGPRHRDCSSSLVLQPACGCSKQEEEEE